MAAGLEREIKIRFGDAAAARAAVAATGAAPLRPRRLQHDCLLDTPDGLLRNRRSALRVRIEPGTALLTFKGPVLPSAMKLRQEIETGVDNPELLVAILERLGFRVWFRYEKYREEFTATDAVIAIDETPVGIYVEIEGSEDGVNSCASALGAAPHQFVLDSYRGLFVRYCEERGISAGDMLFDRA